MISPRLMQMVLGAVFGFAALVGVAFTWDRRPAVPLLIIGAWWLVMGVTSAVLSAAQDLPEAAARVLGRVGMAETGGASVVDAALERAELFAGSLGQPARAVAEIEGVRRGARLDPAEETRLGLALADLYAGPLGEPGRAMAELRRVLDRHPGAPGTSEVRARLDRLRHERFEASPGETPA